MDHYRIQRDIQSGKAAPVYVLMGDEPFFVDQITDYVEEHALSEADKAFNQTIVYGRDVSMDQVLSVAKGFPMSGDRQVVIVKEAQDLKEWKKGDSLAGFEHYMTQPQPATLLIFAFKNKNLDKRLKVSKLVAKHGVIFESKKIKEYQLPSWIEGYLDPKGRKIEQRAANLLAEYLGSHLSKLANALDKLAIVVPESESINLTHIEENIGISKDFNVFELQKALGSRDIYKANQIINYFEANPKANPIQMVLPVLYNFFARLLAYQTFKGSRGDIPKALGVSPWALKDVEAAATSFPPQKTERIIGYIRDVDRKSKGVDNYSLTNGMLMKEMVYKILH